jgi:hypothetical protein
MKTMSSPFPGMDPYLEGALWPDVHHSLAYAIRRHLVTKLPEQYIARIEVAVLLDEQPENEIGIMYPDVEVLRKNKVQEPAGVYTTPATFQLDELKPVEVRTSSVHIRDAQNQQLITAIEILSPVNKRGKGAHQYQLKRQTLKESGVHLLEIDLLRRGHRAVSPAQLPKCDYLISLLRAHAKNTDLWVLQLRDKLPILPIPLKSPDEDIALPLGQIFNEIYTESRYGRSVDYNTAPPPPQLSEEDLTWVKKITNQAG